MNQLLAKYLLMIIEYIRNERTFFYLIELEHNQMLSKEEILKVQSIKFNKLINYVTNNNNYYINKYSDMHEYNVLRKIPVLKKEELRENYYSILSGSNSSQLDLVKTSGSTGLPIKMYRDRIVFGYNLASLYRAHKWHKLEVGSKEAMLWGIPVNVVERCKARIRDALLNRFREKEFNLTKDILFDFYKKIQRNKPVYLYGYSSMIYEFALFMQENQLSNKDLSLRYAICTAEAIHDYQRDVIERVLRCRVLSEYGSTETGVISFECPEGKNHIFDDCVMVEVVDDNYLPLPTGEVGKILVTVLNSFSFPIIRYDLGDYGSLSRNGCSCGLPFTVLDKIVGRTNDIIFTPEGLSFHSIIIYYIIKEINAKYAGIKQYKVIQTHLDRIEFHIVKSSDFTQNVEDVLRNKLCEVFGFAIKISFYYPDSILRDVSGKLRDFESLLDTEKFLLRAYSLTQKIN